MDPTVPSKLSMPRLARPQRAEARPSRAPQPSTMPSTSFKPPTQTNLANLADSIFQGPNQTWKEAAMAALKPKTFAQAVAQPPPPAPPMPEVATAELDLAQMYIAWLEKEVRILGKGNERLRQENMFLMFTREALQQDIERLRTDVLALLRYLSDRYGGCVELDAFQPMILRYAMATNDSVHVDAWLARKRFNFRSGRRPNYRPGQNNDGQGDKSERGGSPAPSGSSDDSDIQNTNDFDRLVEYLVRPDEWLADSKTIVVDGHAMSDQKVLGATRVLSDSTLAESKGETALADAKDSAEGDDDDDDVDSMGYEKQLVEEEATESEVFSEIDTAEEGQDEGNSEDADDECGETQSETESQSEDEGQSEDGQKEEPSKSKFPWFHKFMSIFDY